MSIVTSIIDYLRRKGPATVRSALKRQDEYLRDKVLIERRQISISGSEEPVQAFIATVAPAAEVVTGLPEEVVQSIRENARLGLNFLRHFDVAGEENWTLRNLDDAFARWQAAKDRLGFSDDYVIEVLGALFGEHCIGQLNMRWVRVEDGQGACVAIEGVERQFRAFPYHAISKRIRDAEHGFFQAIYLLLQHQAQEANEQSACK